MKVWKIVCIPWPLNWLILYFRERHLRKAGRAAETDTHEEGGTPK